MRIRGVTRQVDDISPAGTVTVAIPPRGSRVPNGAHLTGMRLDVMVFPLDGSANLVGTPFPLLLPMVATGGYGQVLTPGEWLTPESGSMPPEEGSIIYIAPPAVGGVSTYRIVSAITVEWRT